VLPTWGSPGPVSPRADWTFRITNPNGHYLFRLNGLPDGWMLRSVRMGGRDVIDAPIVVVPGGASAEGLQLVVGKEGATVTGEVVDRSGEPSPDAVVLVFAENRAQWGIGSRFLRVVRPQDRTAGFSVSGLPPGVYRVIARDFVVPGQWEDAEFLQSLLRDATRVELADGGTEKVSLTIREAK
jgi:hypothetical protein